jgi:hypothetical protein
LVSTAWSFYAKQLVYYRTYTALTCLYRYRSGWTVAHAGTAFHAQVSIVHDRFSILDGKNGMGADYGTHTAADTFFLVIFQGDHIINITQFSHLILLLLLP